MRPRLTIGTAGDISCSTADSGTVTARTRFRDWDGVTRLVQASGRTRAVAEWALKEKLAVRAEYRPGNSDLTTDSTFKELADWRVVPTRDRDRGSSRLGWMNSKVASHVAAVNMRGSFGPSAASVASEPVRDAR